MRLATGGGNRLVPRHSVETRWIGPGLGNNVDLNVNVNSIRQHASESFSFLLLFYSRPWVFGSSDHVIVIVSNPEVVSDALQQSLEQFTPGRPQRQAGNDPRRPALEERWAGRGEVPSPSHAPHPPWPVPEGGQEGAYALR